MNDDKKNVLENGSYTVSGPENGNIEFHRLELKAESGAKRIWKVKSMTQKEIIFEVEKFG